MEICAKHKYISGPTAAAKEINFAIGNKNKLIVLF